jgi:hypothetical protein
MTGKDDAVLHRIARITDIQSDSAASISDGIRWNMLEKTVQCRASNDPSSEQFSISKRTGHKKESPKNQGKQRRTRQFKARE